ncbi:MAG: hypothetical protein JWL84_20 [Rhodospirillales bacterium]|nr:hypothetical protein [Rhodospirillales bacterium]
MAEREHDEFAGSTLAKGRFRMRARSLSGFVALTVVASVVAGPAVAQSCPAGYYFASDGRCYPGGPPAYPPPVYDPAPPVYQPPPVYDGFALGIGVGALAGVFAGRHDGGHFHDRGGWHGDRGGHGHR